MRDHPSSPASKRISTAFRAWVVLSALFALHCALPPPAPPPSPARLSLLAVGDTGFPLPAARLISNQYAVARAMDRADSDRSIDGLLFLGDNFYPNGLEERSALSQIRRNLVRPYCRFMELEGPRSAEIQRACRRTGDAKHAVPIYAVLGNHDHKAPGSPERESELIPQFISNWKVPKGLAEVVELDAGISLILYDSHLIRQGADASSITDAIRHSQGPWRILVGHHPIATKRGLKKEGKPSETYAKRVIDAVVAAELPVQLVLMGHEHSLQVLALPEPAPRLHLTVGGGAKPRKLKTRAADRRFGMARLGFARVDLIGQGENERLLTSMYALPSHQP